MTHPVCIKKNVPVKKKPNVTKFAVHFMLMGLQKQVLLLSIKNLSKIKWPVLAIVLHCFTC
jgi:hypothetical protein